jgi:hypothetical protein
MHPIRSLSLDDLDYDREDSSHGIVSSQGSSAQSRNLERLSDTRIGPKSTFVLLRPGMYVALYDKKQAELIGRHELNRKRLVLVTSAGYEKSPEVHPESADGVVSLEEIFKFDKICNALRRQNAGDAIIFYTGSHALHQSRMIFLLGCHLMMSHDYSSTDVKLVFHRLDHSLQSESCCEFSMRCCWDALEVARSNGWVDFREHFDTSLHETDRIDMDEYLHYAR